MASARRGGVGRHFRACRAPTPLVQSQRGNEGAPRLSKQPSRADVDFGYEQPGPATGAVLEAGFTVVTRLGSLWPSLKHCSLLSTCLTPAAAPDDHSAQRRLMRPPGALGAAQEHAPSQRYKFMAMRILPSRCRRRLTFPTAITTYAPNVLRDILAEHVPALSRALLNKPLTPADADTPFAPPLLADVLTAALIFMRMLDGGRRRTRSMALVQAYIELSSIAGRM
ncbi:hypothetical protein EV714DRAFT_276692 [Schizophyllum commune]